MNRILVLVNNCFKNPSANGYCIENIIREFSNDDIKIDVVSFGQNGIYVIDKNITVYNVYNSVFKSFRFKVIQKIINRIIGHFFSPDINYIYASRMIKTADKLLKTNKYDVVISSSGGFISQYCAYKIWKRNPNICWKALFLDPPVSVNFLYKPKRIYYKYWISFEKKVFDNCKKIVLEKSIYDSLRVKYSDNTNLFATGIPLIVRKNYKSTSKSVDIRLTSTINIAFFGTLYKTIRNPIYSIELLVKEMGCSIDFYGGESTKEILEDMKLSNVLYKGFIQHEDLYDVACQYDYLLNISNTNIVQTPSKLFEYISFGLPIINIIQDKNDITKKIIDKYGNGISILQGLDCNKEILKKYFDNGTSNVVDYEYLSSVFPENLPIYTCELLAV